MHSTFKVFATSILIFTTVTLLSLKQSADKPAQLVCEQLIKQSDSLQQVVKQLQAIPLRDANTAELQQRFRQVRLAYKRLEWAVEYFDPLTTRLVNGPSVPEVELSGQVIDPDGLQMIEGLVFPNFEEKNQSQLQELITRLSINAAEFKDYFQHANLQEWQILDAAKLEIFRVQILGLNDFDDPLLKNCFEESAVALGSVQQVIKHYSSAVDFQPSISYLLQPVKFDDFDRARFITVYANPLSRKLRALHKQLNLPDIRYNRLLNQDAATLFDKNAFNRNAYIFAPEDSVTPAKVALGKRLFFDKILSGAGTRSCASCHQPDKAFTDGLIKNMDITGKKFIARNTPTLINAALQPAQFYDLRAASLEDQAEDVVQNKDEMHGDMQLAIGKLWRNASYRKQFSETYPQHNRAAIDTFEVMNALASYVRSLTALNSRFDTYMQGKSQTLTQNEVKGFNLFMGKARCSTCHYLPLFNGALPPRYMQMESEIIGVPQYVNGKQIDPDLGTYNIQPFDFNRHAFKITTVRNASKTAPYMHNGVFRTLEEVVDFYDAGGGVGTGIAVPNQTLPADSLHLTPKEKLNLIAFINSLDSH